MTDELNTQTVVETTEAPAMPAVEAGGAQDQTTDLDTLLAQYDRTTKPATQPAPVQQPVAAQAPPELMGRVEHLEKTLAAKEFQEAIGPVLNRIRGDIPKDVLADDEIQDLIDGRARRDVRLQQAWLNRAENPQAWSKIERALGMELSKKFSKLPDPNATEDREAVTAAVRGASSRAPEGKAPSFKNLSDGEYRRAVKEQYGFDPGV